MLWQSPHQPSPRRSHGERGLESLNHARIFAECSAWLLTLDSFRWQPYISFRLPRGPRVDFGGNRYSARLAGKTARRKDLWFANVRPNRSRPQTSNLE